MIEKLIAQTNYTLANSPFYKNKFSPIRDLEEFNKIPFTTKMDLANFNVDFLGIHKKDIAEICTTSGSTGNPVSIYLSSKDLDRLALNEKYTFDSMGIDSDDIVQLMLTLDKQFMAGVAYYSGLKSIGSTIIRTGPANPEIQLQSIIKNKVTTLISIPSFLIKMKEFIEQENIDMKSFPVKKILCIGETIYNEDMALNSLGRLIKNFFNADLYSTYASSEMQTASSDCTHHTGLHINANMIYIEVVDENGAQVPSGEIGEVIATPLDIEGMPLLRYKTEDICRYDNTLCACGSFFPRLGPVLGRKNQMLKINGTTIFPLSITQILQEESYIEDFIIVCSYNDHHMDSVIVYFQAADCDDVKLQFLSKKIQQKLRVSIQLAFSTKEHIDSFRINKNSSKTIRFVDQRK